MKAHFFTWPGRVYYEDTDAGGVVYYANYLKFLERARTEWLRALGFELPVLSQEHSALFMVRTLTIEYLRAARFNDTYAVTVAPQTMGATKLELKQEIRSDEHCFVSANVGLACVHALTFKPIKIPQPLRNRLVNEIERG